MAWMAKRSGAAQILAPLMDNKGFCLSANLTKFGAYKHGCVLIFKAPAESKPDILSCMPSLSSVLEWRSFPK